MTASVAARDVAAATPTTAVRKPFNFRRAGLHLFLIAISILWLFPTVWVLYTSFRPYADTAARGYVSLPGVVNLDNYINAWNQAELPRYFLNTIVIVVPAVFLVLLLGSMMAFAATRFSWRFNIALLMLFTALNLLPAQIVIQPLFRMYLLLDETVKANVPALLSLPILTDGKGLFYDQYLGMIAIHVAFQLGFVTFVLANYMKTLPHELTEAAIVDGAGVWSIYRKVILPLTRPALAAMATLEFTFIYNDFFWALLLMRTGAKYPITSALNNLKGQFFTDNNLIAAGALLVAIPTLIVYFALQKQFISGLTLGSTKG